MSTRADPTQAVLFGAALSMPQETQEFRDLCDELRLCGCPNGLIHLIAGGTGENAASLYFDLLDMMTDALFSVKDICKVTGLSSARFYTALRFGDLPFALQFGVVTGVIKPGVTARLLKLDKSELKCAAKIFTKNGALTSDDLSQLRQVSRENAAAELPDFLFQTPSTVDNDLAENYLCIARQLAAALGRDTLQTLTAQVLAEQSAPLKREEVYV